MKRLGQGLASVLSLGHSSCYNIISKINENTLHQNHQITVGAHTVQAEVPAAVAAAPSWAFTGRMLNYAGAAVLSPSLIFTDGTVCCTSVFDLQGAGRPEEA